MPERKKSCSSFSILPPWSNFIFTAAISIYQLINRINTGVYLAPARKAFLQMILLIILKRHISLTQNTSFEKLFFFQNCCLRGALNRPGFYKSLYVRTYEREKLVVVQKCYITSTLLYVQDSKTVYVILFIWHLIFIMF